MGENQFAISVNRDKAPGVTDLRESARTDRRSHRRWRYPPRLDSGRGIVDEAHMGATAQTAPKRAMPSDSSRWRMPMLNFDNLKKQAKQLVRWHREGYYPVAQRIRAVLHRYRELDDGAILSRPFALADAQELIARELGFDSWKAVRMGGGETQSPTNK
jgi:hypothetical protein